ncbi:MAG TPA: VIT1/CCC1 transporter family protein [Acidimicrobiales bacterium]|nr:VIT1/CCC1 transporter family protein [Acidimicrobiales bacterium]
MAMTPEHHHRDITGGSARAAVFGVSDGLVSNASLILGVAGGAGHVSVVRLAGLAGLIAGACSMAVGEYLSVSAQVELAQRELRLERHEIVHNTGKEKAELVRLYESRGVKAETAEEVATALMADTDQALAVHAREELGVDPEKLGSPVRAAVASFVSFTLGAIVPLLPWLFGTGATTARVVASMALAAGAAVAVGWVLGRFTGRSPAKVAARQLILASISAAIAFGIGHAVGATV